MELSIISGAPNSWAYTAADTEQRLLSGAQCKTFQRPSPLSFEGWTRGVWREPVVLVVLDTRCAVGESNSPLLQAVDKIGRDASSTELSCRLPHLPATDIPVGA